MSGLNSQTECSNCHVNQPFSFKFCPNCGQTNESIPLNQNVSASYLFKRQQQINIRSSERKLDIAIGKIAMCVAEIITAVLTGALDPLAIAGVAKSVTSAVMNLKWKKQSKSQKFHHHELVKKDSVWIWIRAKYASTTDETPFTNKYNLKMTGVAIAVQPGNQAAYNTLQSLINKDVENVVDKISTILQLEDKNSIHRDNRTDGQMPPQTSLAIKQHIQHELDILTYESDHSESENSEIRYYASNINPKCTFSYHLLYGFIGLLMLSIVFLITTWVMYGQLHVNCYEDLEDWRYEDDCLNDVYDLSAANTVVTVLLAFGILLMIIVLFMFKQRIDDDYGLCWGCCTQRYYTIFVLSYMLATYIIYWIAVASAYSAWWIRPMIVAFLASVENIVFLVIACSRDKWKYRPKTNET